MHEPSHKPSDPERLLRPNQTGHASRGSHRSAARGWASLTLVLGVLMLSALGALSAHHRAQQNQRLASLQAHSALALDAAQSGMAWTTALLRSPGEFGDDCQPTRSGESPAAPSSWLQALTQEGRQSTDRDTASIELACRRLDDAWDCDCSGGTALRSALGGSKDPSEDPTTPASPSPAFRVQLSAAPAPGRLRVTVWGCTEWHDLCDQPTQLLSERSPSLNLDHAALAHVAQAFTPEAAVPSPFVSPAPSSTSTPLPSPSWAIEPLPPGSSAEPAAWVDRALSPRWQPWRPIPGQWSKG